MKKWSFKINNFITCTLSILVERQLPSLDDDTILRFVEDNVCISLILISSARDPFPSPTPTYVIHAVVAVAEKEKKRSRKREGGYYPIPRFIVGTPRAPTRWHIYSRKGVSYMRTARHTSTGKRNVAMETTMATLNQYTRRDVGSFVRPAGRPAGWSVGRSVGWSIGRLVGRWRRRKAHVVLSATCESALSHRDCRFSTSHFLLPLFLLLSSSPLLFRARDLSFFPSPRAWFALSFARFFGGVAVRDDSHDESQ